MTFVCKLIGVYCLLDVPAACYSLLLVGWLVVVVSWLLIGVDCLVCVDSCCLLCGVCDLLIADRCLLAGVA